MESRLKRVSEAYDAYNQTTKILLTVIHMDFPAFRAHPSISPEEASRQSEHFMGDLDLLKDEAE